MLTAVNPSEGQCFSEKPGDASGPPGMQKMTTEAGDFLDQASRTSSLETSKSSELSAAQSASESEQEARHTATEAPSIAPLASPVGNEGVDFSDGEGLPVSTWMIRDRSVEQIMLEDNVDEKEAQIRYADAFADFFIPSKEETDRKIRQEEESRQAKEQKRKHARGRYLCYRSIGWTFAGIGSICIIGFIIMSLGGF